MELVIKYPIKEEDLNNLKIRIAGVKARLILESINRLEVDDNTKKIVLNKVIKLLEDDKKG